MNNYNDLCLIINNKQLSIVQFKIYNFELHTQRCQRNFKIYDFETHITQLYKKNKEMVFKFKSFDGTIIKDFYVNIELNSIENLKILARDLKIKNIYNKN